MLLENYNVKRVEEIEELSVLGIRDYYISDEGWIYSAKTHRFLNPFFNSSGYLRVSLAYGKGERLVISVHKLIALAFLEKDKDCTEIHHKNHIKTDNRAVNLIYCSRQQNMQYYHDYRRQQESLQKGGD